MTRHMATEEIIHVSKSHKGWVGPGDWSGSAEKKTCLIIGNLDVFKIGPNFLCRNVGFITRRTVEASFNFWS